jgi:hypothetical protein
MAGFRYTGRNGDLRIGGGETRGVPEPASTARARRTVLSCMPAVGCRAESPVDNGLVRRNRYRAA